MCDVCGKSFANGALLAKHQSQKIPCYKVKVCHKCRKPCKGLVDLRNHMSMHECHCIRCKCDYRRDDQRTIVPLINSGVSSEFCVRCFYDIRKKFMTFMMVLNRQRIQIPRDLRNLILKWIVVNETRFRLGL